MVHANHTYRIDNCSRFVRQLDIQTYCLSSQYLQKKIRKNYETSRIVVNN